MDFVLPTSTVQGGEGGILINGSGPFGESGGGNISAAGGAGYGAGGGAGGAVYLDSGPLIHSGGRGADGVVYVEMVDSGTFITYIVFKGFSTLTRSLGSLITIQRKNKPKTPL